MLEPYLRDANFIGVDVWIRGDYRSCGVVNTFTHHMLTEQPLLFLENLKDIMEIHVVDTCVVSGVYKPTFYCMFFVIQLSDSV